MEYTTANNGSINCVMTGELTLPGIADIKEFLQQRLAETEDLSIEHKGEVYADATYLQLLISLQKTALAGGKKFTVYNDDLGILQRVAVLSGYRSPLFQSQMLNRELTGETNG